MYAVGSSYVQAFMAMLAAPQAAGILTGTTQPKAVPVAGASVFKSGMKQWGRC